ncbi:MAG: transglutaminase-like domain-containing protein [Gemmatimonadota bacterium]|nr:transglutaminase-like domain-containing protein [Gemmatimonadota bacterium]
MSRPTARHGSVSRRTLVFLLLCGWALALGWLVQRSLYAPKREETLARWPVPPGNSFFAIRNAERQVGLSSFTVDTLAEGIRVTELVTIDLPQLTPKVARRTTARIESIYGRRFELRGWQADLLSESGRSVSQGVVVGDTQLTIINTSHGIPPETLTVALRRPVVLPGAVPLVIAGRGLPRVGDKVNVEVYDPLDHELRIDHLTVVRESTLTVPDSAIYNETLQRWSVAHLDTLRAWRIDGLVHGLPVRRWIDATGMTVRAESPLGVTIERSAFELANTNFRALPLPRWDDGPTAPDLLSHAGDTPAEPLGMRLVLLSHARGLPLPPVIAGLIGAGQQRMGDTLRYGPTAPEPDDSLLLALPPRAALAQPTAELADQARRILGKETRPLAQARRLRAWVQRTITLRDDAGIASAQRILRARQGNAQDRAVLLAGLLHAADLPARLCWGLVREQDRWRLHPWVEVWTDGWTTLDPAQQDDAIPPARIRLATGGRARFMDLALLAGQLRLDLIPGP